MKTNENISGRFKKNLFDDMPSALQSSEEIKAQKRNSRIKTVLATAFVTVAAALGAAIYSVSSDEPEQQQRIQIENIEPE